MSPSVLRSTYEPVSSSRYVAKRRFCGHSTRSARLSRSHSCQKCCNIVEDDFASTNARIRPATRSTGDCSGVWKTPATSRSYVATVPLTGAARRVRLLFWKDAWLKRVDERAPNTITEPQVPQPSPQSSGDANTCTVPALSRAARRVSDDGEEIFSCQATELKRATTSPLPWWEPTQYIRDVRSRNATVGSVVRSIVVGFFNKVQAFNVRFLPVSSWSREAVRTLFSWAQVMAQRRLRRWISNQET